MVLGALQMLLSWWKERSERLFLELFSSDFSDNRNALCKRCFKMANGTSGLGTASNYINNKSHHNEEQLFSETSKFLHALLNLLWPATDNQSHVLANKHAGCPAFFASQLHIFVIKDGNTLWCKGQYVILNRHFQTRKSWFTDKIRFY